MPNDPMAPHQVQKPQRSTYAPSTGSSTRRPEDKARKSGRRKSPLSPSRPSQPSRTRRQQRARLGLASSSDGSLPPRSDSASASDASETAGARNGSASPQATGTTLVTGGTTIHSLNGMVTVNVSGANAGSESPSNSSSSTLASPQIALSIPLSSSETYEAISDVYRRHMGLRKKGRHALWSPQPYLQLPFKYRKGGTQVGDVGIITDDGAFDFMFNICGMITQGASELSNLPAGIVPIYPPVGEEEVSIMAEHSARDALTSQGVSKHTLPNGEFVFTCAQPSGAILVLPDGSVTARLLNYARFQKYYVRNAEAWYTFALTTRGPDVRNGDLHLVYGCEKATEWGIAAFDNPHRIKQHAEHRFRNMGEEWRSSTGTLYVWDHTDDAIGKVGPRDKELRELGASRDEPLRNQTLFIQSINTTLREEDWKRITNAVSMDVSMDFGSSESTSARSISPGPPFTSADSSSQNQLQGSMRAPSMSRDFNSISSPRKQPSQVLNEYLLNQYREAKVAAIASEVWSHVEDECLGAPEMLIAAVLAVYSPVVDAHGLASFVNNADCNTTSTTPLPHHLLQGTHVDIADEASSFQAPPTSEAAPNSCAQSIRDVDPSLTTESQARSRKYYQLQRQRWTYAKEDRMGEEKERRKNKEPWNGMQPGTDELWVNGSSGKFNVICKNTPNEEPGKPPHQRLFVHHVRVADSLHPTTNEPIEVPSVTIHKHSKAWAFTISRHYRIRAQTSQDAEGKPTPPTHGDSGPIMPDSSGGGPRSHMIFLATHRVRKSYSSTNTRRRLESRGFLGDNFTRSRDHDWTRQEGDVDPQRYNKAREKERRNKEMDRQRWGGERDKERKRQKAAEAMPIERFGSVARVVDMSEAPTSASASPVQPVAHHSPHASIDQTITTEEMVSSDKTINQRRVLPAETQDRDTVQVADYDDDYDDDSIGLGSRRRYLTSHQETYITLPPESFDVTRTERQQQALLHWINLGKDRKSDQSLYYDNPYNLAWSGVSSASSTASGSGTGTIDDLSISFDYDVCDIVPSDSLYMLIPLWPGETDPSSAEKYPTSLPPIPAPSRHYLLIWYNTNQPLEERHAAAGKKDKKGFRSSLTEWLKHRREERSVIPRDFHIIGRVLSYQELQGSGARLPDVGLAVSGPLDEAYTDTPHRRSDVEYVLGRCLSHETGVEFVPEGFEKLGLGRTVSNPSPGEPSNDDSHSLDTVCVPTALGRAVMEMAWVGMMAVTSLSPDPST